MNLDKIEKLYSNNIKEFYINVINSKHNILILANAPHPDIAALKNALSNNQDVEINSKLISEFKESKTKYDLIIYHNLPSSNHDIPNSLITAKTPQLYIVGTQSNFNKINKLVSNGNCIVKNNSTVCPKLFTGVAIQ